MDFNIKKIWGAPLLTNIGLVMLALAFIKLFIAPYWYMLIAGGLVIAGTMWWLYNQIK